MFPSQRNWYACLNCHQVGFGPARTGPGRSNQLSAHRLQTLLATAWLQFHHDLPSGLLRQLGLDPQHPLLERLGGRLGCCVWPDFLKYSPVLRSNLEPLPLSAGLRNIICLTLPVERMPGYIVGWLMISRHRTWMVRATFNAAPADLHVYLVVGGSKPLWCSSIADALAEWLTLPLAPVTIVAPLPIMSGTSSPTPRPEEPPPRCPRNSPAAAEESSADPPAPGG